MNHFIFLRDKTDFLRAFYDLTTAPFTEIKRKIDDGEEPYVDRRNPEDCDEPLYLVHWLEADEGLKIQQQLCLNLLQRSLREFLDMTVEQRQGEPVKRKKRENWFDAYKIWFLEEAGVNWEKAPVPLSRIEELTIAAGGPPFQRRQATGGWVTLVAQAADRV